MMKIHQLNELNFKCICYRQLICLVETCPARIAVSHKISSSSYPALPVQTSIILDWMEP